MNKSQKTQEQQQKRTEEQAKLFKLTLSRTLVRRLEKLADSKKMSFNDLVLFILSKGVNTQQPFYLPTGC